MFVKVQTNQEGIVVNSVNAKFQNVNAIIDRMRNNYVYLVNKNDNSSNGDSQLFLYAKVTNGPVVFIGMMYNSQRASMCNVMCKSEDSSLMGLVLNAMKFMLASDY